MPASARPVSPAQNDLNSVYPRYYYPLYGSSSSSSLFEPILMEKLRADRDGRWNSDQVRDYVSEYNKVHGSDLDAEEMFSLYDGEADMDAADTDTGTSPHNGSGSITVIESLLSSGSYSIYDSLLSSKGQKPEMVLKAKTTGSGRNGLLVRVYGSNIATESEPGWFTKLAEPEPEPKFDKTL